MFSCTCGAHLDKLQAELLLVVLCISPQKRIQNACRHFSLSVKSIYQWLPKEVDSKRLDFSLPSFHIIFFTCFSHSISLSLNFFFPGGNENFWSEIGASEENRPQIGVIYGRRRKPTNINSNAPTYRCIPKPMYVKKHIGKNFMGYVKH